MYFFTYLYMIYLKMEKSMEGIPMTVNLDFMYVWGWDGGDVGIIGRWIWKGKIWLKLRVWSQLLNSLCLKDRKLEERLYSCLLICRYDNRSIIVQKTTVMSFYFIHNEQTSSTPCLYAPMLLDKRGGRKIWKDMHQAINTNSRRRLE